VTPSTFRLSPVNERKLVRLKAPIETGGTVPSVILRKLAAAGPRNALSRALRSMGRIERTLFTLRWLSDPDPQQRSHAGLNKGESGNSLHGAIFFHSQGEIRDSHLRARAPRIESEPHHRGYRSLEHRLSGELSKTCGLRVVSIPDDLLPHVGPLGCEHIALAGDYVWAGTEPASNFRPLTNRAATPLSRPNRPKSCP
jgi:hypothetical protein